MRSETELAEKVIEWLHDLKWEVYQEVQVFSYGSVADIVAKQGSVIWVIETKLSMGLQVLAQAYNWLSVANYVSVAIPWLRQTNANVFGETMAGKLGIGILRVSEHEEYRGGFVKEKGRPTFRRKIGGSLRYAINENHKTYAPAGNPDGRRWSPFKQTCQNVQAYVEKHPGAILKEVVDNIETHYGSTSTAKACIAQWAEAGKIEGIKVERDKKLLRFYSID